MQHISALNLVADDGYKLAGTHFNGSSSQFLVLGGATGVPRGFYRRFAEYAQSRGLHVITLDYRGIGDSKPKSLRGFEMDYADWSRRDLAAAVAYAHQRGKVWLVGHSLGGHAIGQLPDPSMLEAAYVCATGAGWSGWMPPGERAKIWLLWNVIGPAATRVLGYQPMSKLGMGEDLPMGVYRDWRHWCSYPNYFFDDPNAKSITEKFADVRIPIAALAATDDLWALPASRDAFFKGYTGTVVDRINLEPHEIGVREIGHMGYFRQKIGVQLWPRILDWLSGHGLQPTSRGEQQMQLIS